MSADRIAELEAVIGAARTGLDVTLTDMGPIRLHWADDDHLHNIKVRHLRAIQAVRNLLDAALGPQVKNGAPA